MNLRSAERLYGTPTSHYIGVGLRVGFQKSQKLRSGKSLGPNSKELSRLKFMDPANPACGEIVSAIQFHL